MPDGTVLRPSGKVVVWTDNGRGYMRTSVRIHGTRKTSTVTHHRVVAETLIPNPEGYGDINHINGNKADCRPENLEWCTRSHNMLHAWATGLSHASPLMRRNAAERLRVVSKTYPRDKGGRCAPLNSA